MKKLEPGDYSLQYLLKMDIGQAVLFIESVQPDVEYRVHAASCFDRERRVAVCRVVALGVDS